MFIFGSFLFSCSHQYVNIAVLRVDTQLPLIMHSGSLNRQRNQRWVVDGKMQIANTLLTLCVLRCIMGVHPDVRYAAMQVHKYTGTMVRRYAGTQVHRYTGTQVRRYTGAQVHRYPSKQVHR